MMKTVTISKTGGPEVLELKEINLDKPGPDEVLIEPVSYTHLTLPTILLV